MMSHRGVELRGSKGASGQVGASACGRLGPCCPAQCFCKNLHGASRPLTSSAHELRAAVRGANTGRSASRCSQSGECRCLIDRNESLSTGVVDNFRPHPRPARMRPWPLNRCGPPGEHQKGQQPIPPQTSGGCLNIGTPNTIVFGVPGQICPAVTYSPTPSRVQYHRRSGS